MSIKDILHRFLRPVLNLEPRARILQLGRLGTSAIIIILTLFLVFYPLNAGKLYVTKLSCSHVDVSNGIFTSLQKSMNSGAGNRNADGQSFMTTSEIQILSQYTSQQVSKAGQFIQSNLMSWCYGMYDSAESYNPQSGMFMRLFRGPSKLYCSNLESNDVVDYRGQLAKIGLGIVLSYAYSNQDFSSENQVYVPDPEYTKNLKERKNRNFATFIMILTSILLHALILVLGYIYYDFKGKERNDKLLPNWPKHVFGLAAMLSFMLFFTSEMIQLSLVTHIKKEVSSQLGDFGLSLNVGGGFIAIFWVIITLSFASIFFWGAPVWCAVSHIDDEDITEEVVPLKPRNKKHPSQSDRSSLSSNDCYRLSEFVAPSSSFLGSETDLSYTSSGTEGSQVDPFGNAYSTKSEHNTSQSELFKSRPSVSDSTRMLCGHAYLDVPAHKQKVPSSEYSIPNDRKML